MKYEHELRPAVVKWLENRGCLALPCEILFARMCDVVGVRFAKRVGRGIPSLELVIAVELKVTRIAEVIYQARFQRYHADESYAAMPRERCERMRPATLDRFQAAGIGLLSVDDKVSILVAPGEPPDGRWRDRHKAKLWRHFRKAAAAEGRTREEV